MKLKSISCVSYWWCSQRFLNKRNAGVFSTRGLCCGRDFDFVSSLWPLALDAVAMEKKRVKGVNQSCRKVKTLCHHRTKSVQQLEKHQVFQEMANNFFFSVHSCDKELSWRVGNMAAVHREQEEEIVWRCCGDKSTDGGGHGGRMDGLTKHHLSPTLTK